MMGIDRRQVGILSDRYLDVVLGDARGTLLLLVQAPLIAGAVAGVWANEANDSPMLYFVLCLCAFFLGAVNAAREIVKERSLFLREKMFNLSVAAYLLSKLRVQTILVVVQCVLLAGIVRVIVPMKVNVLAIAAVLLGVGLVGTVVGLTISAWVRTPDRAVAMVPLVVIPQILFSDFVLGEGRLSNWTAEAQRLMPVHWGYRVLDTLRAQDTDWGTVALGPTVWLATALVGLGLSLAKLRAARY